RGAPITERAEVRRRLGAVVEPRILGVPLAAALGPLLACHPAALIAESEWELRRAMPSLWRSGWQPTEIVRQGRRAAPTAGRLLALAVLADHEPRARDTL